MLLVQKRCHLSSHSHLQSQHRIAVALVVTIPSTYYLLLPRSAPNSDDHGHGGHEEHSKESHEEKSEDEGKEEKSDEGKDEKSDDDEKSPAKDSDDKGKDTDTGEEKAEKSDTDKKDSADGSDNSKKSEKSEGGAESKGKGDSKVSSSSIYRSCSTVTNISAARTEIRIMYGGLDSVMSFATSARCLFVYAILFLTM